MNSKVREAGKNIILIILILLMVLLYFLNWITRMNREQILNSSTWIQNAAMRFGIIQPMDTVVRKIDIQNAAFPLSVAARRNGEVRGIDCSAQVLRDFYEATLPMVKEMSEDAFFEGTVPRSTYEEAFSEDFIYMGFPGKIPGSILGQWLGFDAMTDLEQPVNHLLICGEEGRSVLYATAGTGNQIYRFISPAAFTVPGVYGSMGLKPCSLALLERESYPNIEGETLIFSPRDPIMIYDIGKPSFVDNEDDRNLLLSFFGFNPYTASQYPDDDENVYVESGNTLRLDQNGVIIYTAHDDSSGIPVSGITAGNANGDNALLMIEACRSIISQVNNVYTRTVRVIFTGIENESGSGEQKITFEGAVDGVIVGTGDTPYAVFTVRDGMIVEARFDMHTYTASGKKQPLIPLKQAVAAVGDRDGASLQIRYAAGEDGKALPGYYVRRGGEAVS